LLGYVVGMGASYLLLPFFAEGLNVAVSWAPGLAAGAVLLAVLIGSLGSLYPAMREAGGDGQPRDRRVW